MGLQTLSKQIESLRSDKPVGASKDLESKLKALEMDFDLDSEIK